MSHRALALTTAVLLLALAVCAAALGVVLQVEHALGNQAEWLRGSVYSSLLDHHGIAGATSLSFALPFAFLAHAYAHANGLSSRASIALGWVGVGAILVFLLSALLARNGLADGAVSVAIESRTFAEPALACSVVWLAVTNPRMFWPRFSLLGALLAVTAAVALVVWVLAFIGLAAGAPLPLDPLAGVRASMIEFVFWGALFHGLGARHSQRGRVPVVVALALMFGTSLVPYTLETTEGVLLLGLLTLLARVVILIGFIRVALDARAPRPTARQLAHLQCVVYVAAAVAFVYIGTLAVDLDLRETYFAVMHSHTSLWLMACAVLLGVRAWQPGRGLTTRLETLAAYALAIGVTGMIATGLVMGYRGVPRRYLEFLAEFVPPMHLTLLFGVVAFAGLVAELVAIIRAPRPSAAPRPPRA